MTLVLDVFICLINLFFPDFTHEGGRKQAPQSKTGESLVSVGYGIFPPVGGSSIKEWNPDPGGQQLSY